jgi:hypothetical protein
MEGLLFSINFIKLKNVSLISTLEFHSFRDTESIQASPTQTVGSPHAWHVLRHADPFRISIKVFVSNFSGPLNVSPMIHSEWVLACMFASSIHLSSSNGSIRCQSTLQREARAWLTKDICHSLGMQGATEQKARQGKERGKRMKRRFHVEREK